MPSLAEFPWWLGLIIVFSIMGPVTRVATREGRYWSRKGGRRILADAEVARLEAALAERDQVIDDLQRRLLEVESRLDFTERLLADRKEPAPIRTG